MEKKIYPLILCGKPYFREDHAVLFTAETIAKAFDKFDKSQFAHGKVWITTEDTPEIPAGSLVTDCPHPCSVDLTGHAL